MSHPKSKGWKAWRAAWPPAAQFRSLTRPTFAPRDIEPSTAKRYGWVSVSGFVMNWFDYHRSNHDGKFKED